jgi:hypothetical protein
VNMDVQPIDATAQAMMTPAAPAVPAAPAAALSSSQAAATPPPGAHRSVPAPAQIEDSTLHKALSQLIGKDANVSVSFRVVHNPNEIVIVFQNADTGKEIMQVPSETMILMAQFFDKLGGAMMDRTA